MTGSDGMAVSAPGVSDRAMRSTLLLSLLLFVSLSVTAQAPKVVAIVNGEEITAAKLDLLWEQAGEQARAQFEGSGGKQAFLSSYIRKLLLLQDAVNEGYERPKGLSLAEETAKEVELLDLYIRDVIAPTVVTDQDVRKFYDENPRNFLRPERARVRQIYISTDERSKEEAIQILGHVMAGLHPLRLKLGTDPSLKAEFVAAFAKAARDYSEDAAAATGGDMGWVTPEMLEPAIREVVFGMVPGAMSGMVEADGGFYLIVLEEKLAPSSEPFEEASGSIRQYLLSRSTARIVDAINASATRLSGHGRVEIFVDNLE